VVPALQLGMRWHPGSSDDEPCLQRCLQSWVAGLRGPSVRPSVCWAVQAGRCTGLFAAISSGLPEVSVLSIHVMKIGCEEQFITSTLPTGILRDLLPAGSRGAAQERWVPGGQGQRGCWKGMGGHEVMPGADAKRGDFRWGAPTQQHAMTQRDACAQGSKGWGYPGGKILGGKPGAGPGYAGAYPAASPSRNGLAKS